MAHPIRILVVDDNDRVRRGVIQILSSAPSCEVCGVAKDGTEALLQARELLPDLILLDISMPGLNGLEATRVLRRDVPTARILIMSQNDPAHLQPSAIEAGAEGCIDKSHLATDLLPRIASITASLGPPRMGRDTRVGQDK